MNIKPIRYLHTLLFLFLALSLSSIALAGDDKEEHHKKYASKLTIKKAKYNTKKHYVKIKLKIDGKKPFHFKIFDANTHQLLSERTTRDDSPEIKLKELAENEVPCEIQVILEPSGLEKNKAIKHAPDNCSSTPPAAV
ncbi:hypothetical protein [methane-oxidizing endosymbiont of Gigantopelta aegis]|uniref:hypothetical protein n=1 Tax=methane-oxidizing endosymbiont of Gigantopelta aegis TaxID=2794938 RepID=UPI0018DE438F|nr:hypothetical protein [methane-oxidizing endosymbiont of Gigantopelta aegis]